MDAAAASRERATWGVPAGGARGGNSDGVGGVSLLFSRRGAGSGAVRGVALCVPSPDVGTRFLFAGGAEQLGLLVLLSRGAGGENTAGIPGFAGGRHGARVAAAPATRLGGATGVHGGHAGRGVIAPD